MQHMAAREAKNSFGRLIDTARAEPVAIDKYGRTVVVVIAIEGSAIDVTRPSSRRPWAFAWQGGEGVR
ncbi:MAG: hypothetical protein V2I43_19200 [Parvularcula sp.]|jgi:antitoxin (DNA-binding transcriptional repressor) of toxin-antitoxin stability system|nr:hypothetical protein [Parvularcula sp.]